MIKRLVELFLILIFGGLMFTLFIYYFDGSFSFFGFFFVLVIIGAGSFYGIEHLMSRNKEKKQKTIICPKCSIPIEKEIGICFKCGNKL